LKKAIAFLLLLGFAVPALPICSQPTFMGLHDLYPPDCAEAESWTWLAPDGVGVRVTAAYGRTEARGYVAAIPVGRLTITASRIETDAFSVSWITSRRFRYYSGAIYRGYVDLDDPTTFPAFGAFLSTLPQGVIGDLRQALAAGAGRNCNKATAKAGIAFVVFLTACIAGSATGNWTPAALAGLSFKLAYDDEVAKCKSDNG